MASQAVAAVGVQAQVDRSRPIYAGSRFAYSLVVSGGQISDVDIAPLKDFQPSGPSVQNRTSIVNGRASSYQIHTYQLLAPAKGQLTVPSINVTVDSNIYKTQPITVSVVEPGTTKQLDMEMELSTQRCYVGQPVVLTMSFYVWADIVRSEQITNLDIQVPLLADDNFYWESVDTQFKNVSETVLPVNGRKESVYQDQLLRNGVNCVRVRLTKVLIPKTAGTFDVSAASVTADIAVGQKSRSRGRFDDFFGSQYEYKRFGAESKALRLEVQPLPQSGKPADFYGLVGRFTISAEASPTEVNVGDPITLTIHIGGSPYLAPVQWPALDTMTAMIESFKMPAERSDGEIQNNTKVFTQTIRPNHAEVIQVPPIPLSFFDVKAGQYRTVYTKPIPLNVAPTRIVTGGDVESHQLPTAHKQIKAIREGLSANVTSPEALVNQQFSPLAAMTGPAFIGLYVLPLTALLASAVVRYVMTDSPQLQAANRRKKAYACAVHSIRHAGRHEKPSQQVLAALKQYMADKFTKPAGSLTAIDCENILLDAINDTELSGAYREMMAQTEASEYSPMAFQLTDEKQKTILKLLADIEKTIK